MERTIKWHLETKQLKDLKPHPKNPRQISKDQEKHLRTSLEKFGCIEKPIVNKDNTIIGGHQRLKILKKEGYKQIECWVPDSDMSEKDIEELNIRLNKAQGEFDFDILANEWDSIELVDWGFDAESLFGIIDDIIQEDKPKKSKKKTLCPSCGHEF